MRFLFAIFLIFNFFLSFSQDYLSLWETGRMLFYKDSAEQAIKVLKNADSLALMNNDFEIASKIALDISNIYCVNYQCDKALNFLNKLQRILQKNNSPYRFYIFSKIGDIHKKNGDYEAAKEFYLKALSSNVNDYNLKKNLALKLAYIYKLANDFDNFAYYFSLSFFYKDSLDNISKPQNNFELKQSLNWLSDFVKIENKYRLSEDSIKKLYDLLQKKESDFMLLASQQKVKELLLENAKNEILLERRSRRYQLILIMIFFIFLVSLIFLSVSLNKAKKQKEAALKKLKKIYQFLENQKKELEITNKKIVEGINYAKRLQMAFQPSKNILNQYFTEVFILDIPKETLSGDFVWSEKIDNYFFVIEVDCTGHGIPGAIMSTMGFLFLNQIILNHRIFNPSQIILNLDKTIIKFLHHNNDADNIPNDGMDLSILRYDLNKREVAIASVNQFVIYSVDDKFNVIEGDLFSVGAFVNKIFEPQIKNHTITLGKNNIFYLFSDGYIDQFNEKQNKFLLKNFVELIKSVKDKPLAEQKEILRQKHLQWRGNMKQIDDILVVGLKI